MNSTLIKYLFFCLLPCTHISAISMVYNFRIAEITRQPITEQETAITKKHKIIALLFDQYRKKYTNIRQNFAGALASYIYDTEPYYFRIDTAFSHIQEKCNQSTTFSGTETDDILFSVGRNIPLSDQTTSTFSGLFGIPTHRIFRLQHVDFGYSQFGFGIQGDGSHTISPISSLAFGARYIYFVPRDAYDTVGKRHDFTLGNVADVLLAFKNNWNHHGVEVGYTGRARFGARICPHLDETVQKTNYVRSNFYAVYKYKFALEHTNNRLLWYISYGHDHKPKIFGNKYIVIIWTSWNISF